MAATQKHNIRADRERKNKQTINKNIYTNISHEFKMFMKVRT